MSCRGESRSVSNDHSGTVCDSFEETHTHTNGDEARVPAFSKNFNPFATKKKRSKILSTLEVEEGGLKHKKRLKGSNCIKIKGALKRVASLESYASLRLPGVKTYLVSSQSSDVLI